MRNSVLLFVVSCVVHAAVHAQVQVSDDPAANPGRPTISTPATLPPTGYLQFETGFVVGDKSPEFASRYSLISVMKLAITSRLEVLTSVEPIAHFTAGTTRNATADYFLAGCGKTKGECNSLLRPSLFGSFLCRKSRFSVLF